MCFRAYLDSDGQASLRSSSHFSLQSSEMSGLTYISNETRHTGNHPYCPLRINWKGNMSLYQLSPVVPNMGIFHLLEQWPASRDIPVVTTGELSWGEKQWAEVVVTDADKPPTVPKRKACPVVSPTKNGLLVLSISKTVLNPHPQETLRFIVQIIQESVW